MTKYSKHVLEKRFKPCFARKSIGFWQISSDLVVQLVDIKPKALIPLEMTEIDVQYLRYANSCAESNELGYKRAKLNSMFNIKLILIHSIS